MVYYIVNPNMVKTLFIDTWYIWNLYNSYFKIWLFRRLKQIVFGDKFFLIFKDLFWNTVRCWTINFYHLKAVFDSCKKRRAQKRSLFHAIWLAVESLLRNRLERWAPFVNNSVCKQSKFTSENSTQIKHYAATGRSGLKRISKLWIM